MLGYGSKLLEYPKIHIRHLKEVQFKVNACVLNGRKIKSFSRRIKKVLTHEGSRISQCSHTARNIEVAILKE